MQVGNVLIGICIGVIANAIGIFLGYWLRKAREKISESPLRNFWEPFLSDGGNYRNTALSKKIAQIFQ